MNNEKKKRCIAFDMDTKQLEKYYGSDNWQNAYKDIGALLHKFGFTREQGSVYDSQYAMNEKELGNIIDSLCYKLEWFGYCVKSIRGYEQPEITDYTEQAQDFVIENNIILTPKKAKKLQPNTNKQDSTKIPTKKLHR